MTKKSARKKVFIIIFVLLVVFILFLVINSNATINAVTARKFIECGTIVDPSNIGELFEVKRFKADSLPKEYISDAEELNGSTIEVGISENTILQENYVINGGNPLYNMKEPVIMGIKASDMAQFAGGVIRKGDRINISIVDSATNKCINILENIYVTGAYNSDGSEISDESSCAMALNILVEKNEEQKLNGMMAVGELRVCMIGENYNDK